MGTAYFHCAFGNEVAHIIHTVLSIQKVNYIQHNGDSTLLCAGFNLLKPNDIYICGTATPTSRRYILNIYSTNTHTEYFKHAA